MGLDGKLFDLGLGFMAHPRLWPATAYTLLVVGVAYFTSKLLQRPAFPENAPLLYEALPVVGSVRWFTSRDKFMAEGVRASRSGQFSFYVGKHRVVGLSGEVGRKTFLEHRGLDLGNAYSVLFNATPQIEDNNSVDSFSAKIIRNLSKLLKKEWIGNTMPSHFSDMHAATKDLASRPIKVLNPFDDFYRLIYQLTMRTVGCDDIADDPVRLRKTLDVFEMIEGSTAPTSMAAAIVFPWLPTMRNIRMMWGGTQFYMIIAKIIEERAKKGTRGKDAMQMLIDQGDNTAEVVRFILSALFAGLINSGINAAWLLIYMGADPHWYAAIQGETDAAVARHRTSPDQTAVDILSTLSIEDFEAEFPLLDLGLRETIRQTMTGTGFRYNDSGKDIPIGETGEVIPKGAFAVYLIDDVSYDTSIYTDPQRWDPGRFLPDRAEDKKAAHAYLGWGSGRHPCLGMRFAKVEMAVMISCFIATFDFELCKKDGTQTNTVPPISRDRISAHKPDDPVYIKYKLRT